MSIFGGLALYAGIGCFFWFFFFHESKEKKVLRLRKELKRNIFDRSGVYFLDPESGGQLAKARIVAVLHSDEICCVFTPKLAEQKYVYGVETICVQMSFEELKKYFQSRWGGYYCPSICQQKFKDFLTKREEKKKSELLRKEKEKQVIFVKKKSTSSGYVYCLSNPAMPGLLKIGYTKHSPRKRAEQLFKEGGTGVPAPFKLEFYFCCNDPRMLERAIHDDLSEVRYSYNREFFQISVERAKAVFQGNLPTQSSIITG